MLRYQVFSDTDIAKKFLEDFLNETITEIEQLGDKHRVTRDAWASSNVHTSEVYDQPMMQLLLNLTTDVR